MLRSRLPVPSLLSLFGALLMLSPELLLGIPEGVCDVPLTDPEVQKALAFAMQQYNQRRSDINNYFKVLRVVKVQSQVENRDVYDFTVELVETKCKKKAGKKRTYERIQRCKEVRRESPETKLLL